MKIIKFLILFVFFVFVVGCGHSVIRIDTGTGLNVRLPNPCDPGSDFVTVQLGDIYSKTYVLRGGVNINGDISKGGTLGTVSTADHLQINTQQSMNEGYYAQVLINQNIDEATRLQLAKNLQKKSDNKILPSHVTSINSGSASGQKTPEVKVTRSGIDNIVDKTGQLLPSVVHDVSNVAIQTTDNVKQTVKQTGSVLKVSIIYLVIGIVIIIICIVIAGVVFHKYKKKLEIQNK